ncbi:hypothetical protein GH714_031737 [Hevea brasiliensis]|uniref:DUF3444 domain-containing protein n=1 Tax=Hevea brasiliensis TaxID=3981 RepID=A0A6A6M4P4_HEVBR|nr:hypothetical protein GH714_031737 [Hevea brasiliensis]
MGFHVSCGRFKVSRKTTINSLDIFSHIVDCERAARGVYRIYPKKGSVWALYNEVDLGVEERNPCARDKQCYEIVVFLTTYSEMHGLSMAYLEKVDGFKTVFKRREVGCHAIRLLGKDEVWLLSHQIPSRKLSGSEMAGNVRCEFGSDNLDKLGFTGSYPNRQQGNYPIAPLDRPGNFQEGSKNRMLGYGPSTQWGCALSDMF